MPDNVNHPSHYISESGLEALDVIEAFFHDNYFLGNVFKYIARAGKKGDELEDLQKAEVYLGREIQRVSGSSVPEDDSFFSEHMSQPVQPRVWDRLSAIELTGFQVVDRLGRLWFPLDGNWLYFNEYGDAVDTGFMNSFHYNHRGPFTEVVDPDGSPGGALSSAESVETHE